MSSVACREEVLPLQFLRGRKTVKSNSLRNEQPCNNEAQCGSVPEIVCWKDDHSNNTVCDEDVNVAEERSKRYTPRNQPLNCVR